MAVGAADGAETKLLGSDRAVHTQIAAAEKVRLPRSASHERPMKDPSDPEIAPRRLLFFLSAERVSAGKRWLLGAAGNAVRAEGRRISVPLPPKEMCSTSSPTGWCHCHHDTTSALCCAEPRSVGALDRTPLPVGCLASEKSTI